MVVVVVPVPAGGIGSGPVVVVVAGRIAGAGGLPAVLGPAPSALCLSMRALSDGMEPR